MATSQKINNRNHEPYLISIVINVSVGNFTILKKHIPICENNKSEIDNFCGFVV